MDEMDRLFRQSDFSAENEELEKRIWNRMKRPAVGFFRRKRRTGKTDMEPHKAL